MCNVPAIQSVCGMLPLSLGSYRDNLGLWSFVSRTCCFFAEFIRILLSLCDLYSWVYMVLLQWYLSSYLSNYDVVVEVLIMGYAHRICAHHFIWMQWVFMLDGWHVTWMVGWNVGWIFTWVEIWSILKIWISFHVFGMNIKMVMSWTLLQSWE